MVECSINREIRNKATASTVCLQFLHLLFFHSEIARAWLRVGNTLASIKSTKWLIAGGPTNSPK